MRTNSIMLAGALAIAVAGCSSSDNEASDDLTIDNSVGTDISANDSNAASADATMPTDAAGFANMVAASDMYEIESGKLAADRAASADVKSFAAQLQTDHSKSAADLKAAAQGAGITVTPALDAEKQGMLDALKAAKGDDFDRLFIDQQTTAHQKALQLLQNYASAGDKDALKAFATKATAVVEGHLNHLNGIKK